jgi:hypothetical protein
MAATGEGPNICVPYVQQHPFFLDKRHLFKTAEDRKRDRDAAAIAAEPGPIVWVRRQFDHHRHAAYRLADVEGWHWSSEAKSLRIQLTSLCRLPCRRLRWFDP